MPQDRRGPGTAEDWLSRAKGDLALAKAPLPEGAFYEDLCFHAHQAAEKAIKAVYLSCGYAFRYTHDLDELLDGLEQVGLVISRPLKDSIVLTSYAWEARYPGLGEPIAEAEYREAVDMAERVVQWAQEAIPS